MAARLPLGTLVARVGQWHGRREKASELMATETVEKVSNKDGIGQALTALVDRVRASVVEVRSGRHGTGAGTIWRSDGIIVTNHHVAGGDEAEVTLADGRAFAASVVARDPHDDLAVLRIGAAGLPAVAVGDARALRPGELVLAVGHPFGVRGAATLGLVSATLSHDAEAGRELIRADVRLGPGNSGGPLVDAAGRVLGINAMVAGGMGLAVPSHLVERLVSGLTGRPALGVEARDVELAPLQRSLVGRDAGRAVLLVEVAAGGPAEQAGLQAGDILLALDGRSIERVDDLLHALTLHEDGSLAVRLLRGVTLLDLIVQPVVRAERAA
jgi:serine protease Do